MAKKKTVVEDFVFPATNDGKGTLVTELPKGENLAEEVVEDIYLDNDELDPFQLEVAEKLGHLIYMVRRGRYSDNQIRKLRAQLASVNVE